MDQNIVLAYSSLKQPVTEDPGQSSEIYTHRALDSVQREQRGDLVLLVEARNSTDQTLDLPKLRHEIFATVEQSYYSDTHGGGPLESLEAAVHQARERAQLLAGQQAEVALAALAIWGRTLVYVNPNQSFMGIRREHEFFELDQPAVGNELIKDGDLVVLAGQTIGHDRLRHRVREQQALNNPDWQQFLLDEDTKEGVTVATLILVTVLAVPSEEEVIEIRLPEKEERTRHHWRWKGLAGVWLSKLKVLKPTEPVVYIKPSLPSGRRGKLVAVIVLLALLSGSVLVTYLLNTQRVGTEQELTRLDAVAERLAKANQLSVLNPSEARNLVEQARADLGEVMGTRDDVVARKAEFTTQFTQIENKIYQIVPVELRSATPDEAVQERVFSVTETEVQNYGGKALTFRVAAWQTPIQADGYLNNLYLLDPGAGAIWKYLDLLVRQGDQAPSNYLLENVQLTGALDLTIDGSIYVLFPGRVDKYTLGKRDEFSLRGIYPPLTERSLIAAGIESEQLFISSDRGILVFDKSGQYQKLLVADGLSDITELVSSADGRTIFVKILDEWKSISGF